MTKSMIKLQPQQLSFFQFCEFARIEPLTNHGRVAEVFFHGASLGFVDANGIAGLMQAHKREVNNALYARSGDAPEFMSDRALPAAAALAEYPDLRAKFPQASQLADRAAAMPATPAAPAAPATSRASELRAVATRALLAELHERGALTSLHHAVGAVYDHLERAGHLDADSPLLAYRMFRLRRFDAEVSGAPGADAVARRWVDRLGALEVGVR
ncbi:hypothetical protein ACXIVK_36090 [Paraburkholderia caledonica]